MNKVILLVLFMPVMAYGQIMEDFESGNMAVWIQSPEGRWNADNINSISGVFSLHHSYDNPGSGVDRAGLELKNLQPGEGISKWSFKLRFGCDPSSSNNWAFLLMSDSGPPALLNNQNFNGFAVGVNQTGYDDTLRLWKVRNGIFSPVITTNLNWQTEVGTDETVKITVERSQNGEWELQVFNSDGFMIDSVPGYDPELFHPGWIVLSYQYTSSRDRLLWIDDIIVEGVFREDEAPPAILDWEINGGNSLSLTFSEEISEETMALSNFITGNGNNPAKEIIRTDPVRLMIKFEKQFLNKSLNRLTINKICDRLNNCRSDVAIDFTPVWADPGDVIISEIMADPVPAVSLPSREFIEITNTTGYPVNLKNWSLSDNNQKYPLPELEMLPSIPIIICSGQDSLLFRSYGRSIGLKSFPALTDGGKILALSDGSGNLIHGVEYSPGWYGDELKSGGGWSLEIIDGEFPFYGEGNWHASLSKEGGTPGKLNSVSQTNPDPLFTGIENVFPEDSLCIMLRFSETIIGLEAKIREIKIGDNKIKRLFPVDPLLMKYTLIPEEPLEHKKIYKLTASENIIDFAGNKMTRNEFGFGMTEQAELGDILFNEILFNPFSGDPDYIEFCNISGRIIDISRLLLVSVNDETGDTSAIVTLTTEKRCFLPGEYLAVTTNRKRVLERFFSSDPFRVIQVPSLPSMPDNTGHLILFSRELDKIDEVFYDERMHYSLLQNNEGIALEKVRPGCLSGERSNWHSASESSGWGTPGVVNSVFSEEPDKTDKVIFSSTRISPDNDGYEDLLIIDLKLEGMGNIVSISVFDETGSFVKRLTDNFLAGPEAVIVWDGTDESGRIVYRGIYILLISVFDENGKTRKWKKVCAVVR